MLYLCHKETKTRFPMIKFKYQAMNIKHLFGMALTTAAIVLSLSACKSKSNDPFNGRQMAQWEIRMLNHAVNIESGEVESVAIKYQILQMDYTTPSIPSMTLVNGISRPNIPTLTVSNLPITKVASRNRYTFDEPSPVSENVTKLKGYVDFDEQCAKLDYVMARTWHVIAVVPDVFFNNNNTVVTRGGVDYKCTGDMIEFSINPDTNVATVKLLNITFGDTSANFTQIVTDDETPATVKATPEGYTITGQNLKTKAYRRTDPTKAFSDFPFDELEANIDLATETLTMTLKTGEYTITSTGAVK